MILRCLLVLVLTIVFPMIETPFAADGQTSTKVEPLGSHLHPGYGTFAPVSEDQLDALDDRIAEATAAGLDVARVMVDWAEIETSSGSYDRSVLDNQLERVPAGSRLFLTLAVTDVDHYSVPKDLLDDAGDLNSALDAPVVFERYLRLIDAILPELITDYGLFALSVANEPDVLLEERHSSEISALAGFLGAVDSHAREVFPGLPVTLTVSGGGIVNSPDVVEQLIASTSLAAFNWGCIDLATFQVSTIATIPDEMELLRTVANGRDIVIQELSCPSGYPEGDSFIGSSPQFQEEWFATVFREMEKSPQFRVAFVFDLVDWPESLAEPYADFLRAEELNEIADRYEEFLRSWGLLTFEDLAPKPVWTAFLNAITRNAGDHSDSSAIRRYTHRGAFG